MNNNKIFFCNSKNDSKIYLQILHTLQGNLENKVRLQRESCKAIMSRIFTGFTLLLAVTTNVTMEFHVT